MELPLDAARLKAFGLGKEKYLDEETPMFARWFIFGEHEDGTVDVASPQGDVFVRMDRSSAERVIEARDAFCDAVLKALRE